MPSQTPSPTPIPVLLTDPYPDPLPRSAGVTVNIAEFASLPDSEGSAALMMLLLDEPGTQRLFVNDLRGFLYSVSYDGSSVSPYLNLGDPRWGIPLYVKATRGFKSFAFHPQFNTPGAPGYGKFYTLSDTDDIAHELDFPAGSTRRKTDADSILLEWTALDPTSERYDGSAPRFLMRYRICDGMLAFNPHAQQGDPDHGLLYVTLSDPYGGSQMLHSLSGKLLRIDPLGTNSANGQYGVPDDNPFACNLLSDMRREIYAYGFRNPSRFTWDSSNGSLFTTDIGQHGIEEINLVSPGANFGWSFWEGSFQTARVNNVPFVTPNNPRGDPAVTYPVVEYDHMDELFQDLVAITGIVIYRDDAIPPLKGLMLFGDIPSGEIFYVQADALHTNGRRAPQGRVLLIDGGEEKTLLELIQEKNKEQGVKLAQRAGFALRGRADGTVFLLNKRDGVIRILGGSN